MFGSKQIRIMHGVLVQPAKPSDCFTARIYLRKPVFRHSPTKAENAWTWEQFVENAKKLTIDKNGKNAADPDFDPKSIKQYGVTFETWSEPLNNFIYSNGGDWVSKDGKTFTLNNQRAQKPSRSLLISSMCIMLRHLR